MWAILTSKLGLAGVALLLVGALVTGLRIDVAIKTHERDVARAEAKAAQDGWNGCQGKIRAQNAALEALSAKSAAATALAAQQAAAAAPRAARAASQAHVLGGYQPKGSDRCSRWEDADAEVKGRLQ